jgi:hypothetical protein
MLKMFAVGALLTIAMPMGWAEAREVHSDLPPCTTGNAVAATCDCGTADNGRPVLCHAGQWCHPNRACTNQWFADPRELHRCSEKTCSLQHRKNP